MKGLKDNVHLVIGLLVLGVVLVFVHLQEELLQLIWDGDGFSSFPLSLRFLQ